MFSGMNFTPAPLNSEMWKMVQIPDEREKMAENWATQLDRVRDFKALVAAFEHVLPPQHKNMADPLATVLQQYVFHGRLPGKEAA